MMPPFTFEDRQLRIIPFLNHLCLGAKPQAVLTLVPMHLQMHWEDKAKQQQHG